MVYYHLSRWTAHTTIKLINSIEEHIREYYESDEEMMHEIKRYVKEFPNALDYNYAQYGNLLIYYNDIYRFYEKHGFKEIDELFDTDEIWDIYKYHVGVAIQRLLLFPPFE